MLTIFTLYFPLFLKYPVFADIKLYFLEALSGVNNQGSLFMYCKGHS